MNPHTEATLLTSSPSDRARAVEQAWRQLVQALGYDMKDPHLTDSPARVARFLSEWHTQTSDPPKLTTFPNDPKVDELVAVGRIPFYSLCAHHGLPFSGHASVGYIPKDKVLGLSKFARVIDHFARRFQVQERLTHEVASYLQQELDPVGVGVVMKAEHLCMSMRGVERPGHLTVTSDLRGAFRDHAAARSELLALLAEGGRP